MRAKEKAIELVDRYSELGIGHPTSLLLAKQCALIAVDEVLGSLGQGEIYFENEDEIDFTSFFKYWREVKQEIINL